MQFFAIFHLLLIIGFIAEVLATNSCPIEELRKKKLHKMIFSGFLIAYKTLLYPIVIFISIYEFMDRDENLNGVEIVLHKVLTVFDLVTFIPIHVYCDYMLKICLPNEIIPWNQTNNRQVYFNSITNFILISSLVF